MASIVVWSRLSDCARAAKKLANALFGETDRPERDEFLYGAAATIKARGVIEDADLYPPAILDAVASRLRGMGIRDRDIFGVKPGPDAEDPDQAGMLLILHGNRRLRVTISIEQLEW